MRRTLAATALAVTLAGCGSSVTATTAPERPQPRLVTFGHSYVYGLGATSRELSWPYDAGRGACMAVENYGHSGDLGAETALLVDTHRAELQPSDVVAIQTGVNDVRAFGLRADHLENFAAALDDMLTDLQGHKVLLLEAEPLASWTSVSPYDNGNNAALAAYNAAIASAAAKHADVTAVPAPSGWAVTDIAADHVHPNNAGHRAIAATVDALIPSQCAPASRVP